MLLFEAYTAVMPAMSATVLRIENGLARKRMFSDESGRLQIYYIGLQLS